MGLQCRWLTTKIRQLERSLHCDGSRGNRGRSPRYSPRHEGRERIHDPSDLANTSNIRRPYIRFEMKRAIRAASTRNQGLSKCEMKR